MDHYSSERVVTYEPDNAIKGGLRHLFRDIYRDLKDNRWLIQQLFKKDLLASYRQSFVGIVWAFVIPVLSVISFVILNQAGVLDVGVVSVPYPIFAVLGMGFWQLFSTGLLGCAQSLVNAGTMISKINFSKKALVVSSMGRCLVSFVVQVALLICLFVYYGFIPHLFILLLPLFIVPLILFTLGLGFLLSVLNGIARDVGNLLSTIVMILMFLTPVLFSPPESGVLATLTSINPLHYMISTPRDLVLLGKTSGWVGFMVSTVFAVAAFIACLVFFHLTEARVAERV